jgi:O-antigen ligase
VNTALDKRLALVLILIGPIASLAVSPIWNYDPINLIKLIFISSTSFYCLALLASNFKIVVSRVSKSVWLSAILFCAAMISSLIFSGAPLSQQFWGTFGRNTGFLTYFSLLGILISTTFVEKKDFYKSLVNSLVIVSIPMTAYCLIQVAELDPIGWSEKHPFGTLGNINFSSAFFGLSTLCALSLIAEKTYSITLRTLLFILVLVDLLIVYSTGSIQGLMMFVAGAGIQGYIFVQRRLKSKVFSFLYVLIGLGATAITVFGLSNRGPLAKFLFAPSIVFRTDYWHAGLAMTLKFPVFGVGLDSYGDWYRTLRGEISTLRTGPDRIANTAHNIFLDLSSNGGIPLIAAYFFIIFLAFRNGIRMLRQNPNPHSIALFTSWIGFLIFSSISIAQVGVGIWGWLFTGALLGLNRKIDLKDSEQDKDKIVRKGKGKKNINLSAGTSLSGIAGLAFGFILAYVPFQADVRYKTAIQTMALDKIISSSNTPGSTAFHKEMVIDLAIKNNFAEQAKTLSHELIDKYPRDFLGWKAIYLLNNSSEEEKKGALAMLKQLDPFNPEFK